MTFDKAYYNIGYLDRLSYQDTAVHRLDPRAKVICTGLFLITVISYPRYEVSALAPLFLFPAVMMTLGDIPAGFVVKRTLLVSPFVILAGIFNPVFDGDAAFQFYGFQISWGWISFASIMVKSALSISAAVLLVATTSFPQVCHALRRLGTPPLFTTQLVFLYRYAFVLMEEALRIVRARDMRSLGGHAAGPRIFARLLGILFLRTAGRSERIFNAMLARGFQGGIPRMSQTRFTPWDALFMFSIMVFLALCRFFPVTEAAGGYILRLAR